MKVDCRPLGSLIAIALGVAALTSIAQAQEVNTKPVDAPRLPDQVLTGENDAPAASARAAASSRQAEQQLERQLVEMTSESSEGLTQVKRANGSVTVNLEGRFMSVLVATPTADGTTAISCHTGHDAVDQAKHAEEIVAGREPKVVIEQPVSAPKPVTTQAAEEM